MKKMHLVSGLYLCCHANKWPIPQLDMRKPLSRDPDRHSVRSNGRDIIVSAHDVS